MLDTAAISFIDNNNNFSGVYPEDNGESKDNYFIYFHPIIVKRVIEVVMMIQMVLFLKIITKNEYFKLDFSGDFVTQSDDPDFMPDITGGDDYVDYNDYMNGDVLIP